MYCLQRHILTNHLTELHSYHTSNSGKLMLYSQKMDVKKVCLDAPILENVYILQYKGFEKFQPDGNPLVCKMNKSIYGLKQPGRNLLLTLKERLETVGVEACIHDSCFLIKKWISSLAMIRVCGDDIVFCCPENDFYQ